MKIFVAGAGATGSIIAKLLAERPEVEQVLVGDIDAKKARKFLISHPKIAFKTLNAQNTEEIAKATAGFTVIINASLPYFNLNLMQAALESGTHYQDLASDWADAKIEQLQYHDKFKEKSLVGLINASASPGITNLIAGELASQLKRIEYIKIRLLEDVSSEVPFTAWSKKIAFDEFSYKPLVWQFDQFVSQNNFSEEEFYNFPEPFVNRKCYLLAQEDIGTIPLYIKTKYADLKAGGSEIELARTLFKLGFFKKRPIKVGDAKVSPYDFALQIWPDVLSPAEMKTLVESGKLHEAYFWASVEVKGISQGKKITKKKVILFPKQSEINQLYPGANYVSYTAGLTAAIFALHIPKIKERGVFPPEALSSEIRSSIIQELEKNKIKIETNEIN